MLGVIVLLLVPLLISAIFGFIYSMIPSEFGFASAIDPYYFSMTTLSTVGYGDLSPKTDRAKALVMLQQAFIVSGLLTSAIAMLTRVAA